MDLCRRTKQEAGRDGGLLRVQSDGKCEWSKLVSGMASTGLWCCVALSLMVVRLSGAAAA